MTDEEGEVRQLTEKDFANFRPATELLPSSLLQKLGIVQTTTKKHVAPNPSSRSPNSFRTIDTVNASVQP
ncbi:MAG: hypothetical protein KJO08_01165 [Gammaproteobacteria bacterium]|nr:hypothetical protein [Gammaproteobacteria bacterium]NNJ83921.1 hypothetical protein [Gammaproteobacteria bacterium]